MQQCYERANCEGVDGKEYSGTASRMIDHNLAMRGWSAFADHDGGEVAAMLKKSRILREVLETAKSLRDSELITAKTMRKFQVLCREGKKSAKAG